MYLTSLFEVLPKQVTMEDIREVETLPRRYKKECEEGAFNIQQVCFCPSRTGRLLALILAGFQVHAFFLQYGRSPPALCKIHGRILKLYPNNPPSGSLSHLHSSIASPSPSFASLCLPLPFLLSPFSLLLPSILIQLSVLDGMAPILN